MTNILLPSYVPKHNSCDMRIHIPHSKKLNDKTLSGSKFYLQKKFMVKMTQMLPRSENLK